MAQQATASFGQKKPETETAAFASLTAADVVRAPVVQRRIPVDFRPLLKPHKGVGRLCLRIDRLPQGAKLSAGRRGTNGSWSLASDELEDLHFLISSSAARDYELTVRVMTLGESEVSTLKVVQFVVAASDEVAPVPAGRDPDGEDPAIRSQLNEMHSLFAVRETELIELRAAIARAADEREAELAKARSDWELELDRKVAEAVEQARARDRRENEAKEKEHRARATQEALKTEKIAAEQEQAKGESERRSHAERQKWLSETARQIEVARQEWKAEVERTLEAARQTWQAESEKRKKEDRESWKAESEKRIEAERRTWLAQAEGHAARECQRLQSDADQRLEAARQAWQADAEARRRTELEGWKADTEKRIETERETWLVRAGEYTRTEFERSKAEIETRIAAERRNWQMEADEQAKKERDRWEADARQRVDAARLASRAEADAFLAAERARLETEAEQRIAAECQRLVSETAQMPASTVSQGDDETAKRLAEEKDKNWELEAALAAMTLRCENAERAPAAAESPAPEVEDGYIRSLRAEIATLRKSIVSQAAELGRARAALEQSRPLHLQREQENRPIGIPRDVQKEEDQTAGQTRRKGLIRDCILVAAVVIPLILVYPWIAVYLPEEIRDGISTVTGGLLSVEIVQPAEPHASPKKPLPPPKINRPTAVASRVLNVRASPASKGAVILSLPKNASVVVLEKQGNWTEVEVPAEGAGKPQQGWVWSAYLQDKDN